MSFVTALDEVYKEIDVMRKLNHPNLMRVIEIIDCPLSEKLYLIMPVADYGECMSFCGSSKTFIPNHRLQARNVNKILKRRSTMSASFYDEERIKGMAISLMGAMDHLHN